MDDISEFGMKRYDMNLHDEFNNGYVDLNGVYRWNSNDAVPFRDMLTEFLNAGFITREVFDVSVAVGVLELEKLLGDYANKNTGRNLTAEERAEMTSVYGKGSTVVNMITGDRYTL